MEDSMIPPRITSIMNIQSMKTCPPIRGKKRDKISPHNEEAPMLMKNA
jgi:hypothetical protein